jgi:hypothetical protein
MRSTCLLVAILLALLPSAALTQQSPGLSADKSTGETIGHPPPLAGPPPASPPGQPPASANATPPAGDAPAKGYTGAYGPTGPSTPYFSGPIPMSSGGPGLNVAGPDGSTRTIKAVPCGTVARSTDGSTTCIGIPDQPAKVSDQTPRRRRH